MRRERRVPAGMVEAIRDEGQDALLAHVAERHWRGKWVSLVRCH